MSTRDVTAGPTLLDRHRLLLVSLAGQPATVHEYCQRLGGLYINHWAPIATALLKWGYVRRTGERRPTGHGGTSAVLEVTDEGMGAVGGCNTRRVVATTPMRCFQMNCNAEDAHYFRRDHLA
jgi:hypothetical protein